MVIIVCWAFNWLDSYSLRETPANFINCDTLLKLLIPPIFAKIEVLEKREIPGIERIGEFVLTLNSSIPLICGVMSSIWKTRFFILISSAIEGKPIEFLTASLDVSTVKIIRFSLPLSLKYFFSVLISVLEITLALGSCLRMFV